jgi:hypothetical protein
MLRIDLPLGSGGRGWQRKNGCESGGDCDARYVLSHDFILFLFD